MMMDITVRATLRALGRVKIGKGDKLTHAIVLVGESDADVQAFAPLFSTLGKPVTLHIKSGNLDPDAVAAARRLADVAVEPSDKPWHSPATPKITPAQLRELKLLADKPQKTFGKSRVLVQNNLIKKGLAFIQSSGIRRQEIAYDAERCFITDKGRLRVQELDK